MPVVGTGPKVVEPGVGSDVEEERATPHPGDSTDADIAHRFDRTSFREDLGRRECACEGCACADSTACIRKACGCCTVSK
jgi:hypothetical protein